MRTAGRATCALAAGFLSAGLLGCDFGAPVPSDSSPPDAAGPDAGDAGDAAPPTDAGPDGGTDAGLTTCLPGPLPPVTAATLYTDVQPIFDARCATGVCHVAGGLGAGLDLAAGVAWAGLVNVLAGQVQETSMLDLVEPGDPESSYLVHKIQATHLEPPVFGSGEIMPDAGECLTLLEIATIRAWIEAGALDD